MAQLVRGTKFGSSTRKLTTTCNSNSKRFDTLFWPPQLPKYKSHTYTRSDIHPHIIKNKNKFSPVVPQLGIGFHVHLLLHAAIFSDLVFCVFCMLIQPLYVLICNCPVVQNYCLVVVIHRFLLPLPKLTISLENGGLVFFNGVVPGKLNTLH